MSTPANRIATYEDLFSVPDNMIGEIIAGNLVTQPRPGPKHAHAASAASAMLFSQYDFKFTGNSEGWWFFNGPECHLETDIIVPEIAGWRKSSMPEIPETAWFDIRPDWVCEVISPSTAKYDRGAKRDIYAREGVGFLWIVDPLDKLIEVFTLDKGKWFLSMTVADNQIAELPPFLELPFDLSVLWA